MAWSVGVRVVWYVGESFRACTLAGSGIVREYNRAADFRFAKGHKGATAENQSA